MIKCPILEPELPVYRDRPSGRSGFALDDPKVSGATHVNEIILLQSGKHRFFRHTEDQIHGAECDAAPIRLTVGPEGARTKDDGSSNDGHSDIGAHGLTPFVQSLTIDQLSSGIPCGCQTKTSYRCAKPDQIRGDLYGIQDGLDFIKVQLAFLPTRNEVWRAAMLGMIGGAVAGATLIDTFSRACS
jgi:hypothetical protein